MEEGRKGLFMSQEAKLLKAATEKRRAIVLSLSHGYF